MWKVTTKYYYYKKQNNTLTDENNMWLKYGNNTFEVRRSVVLVVNKYKFK